MQRNNCGEIGAYIYGCICLYIVILTLHGGVGVAGVHLLVSFGSIYPKYNSLYSGVHTLISEGFGAYWIDLYTLTYVGYAEFYKDHGR